MQDKIPPHSIEAEKSVIGAALRSEDALIDVVSVVEPEDFYDAGHKDIFAAIIELHNRRIPVDVMTVGEELKKMGSLDRIGGIAYVGSLSAEVPTVSNAEEYAKIVADKASLRHLIAIGDNIVTKAYSGKVDSEEMLGYAEDKIFSLSQDRRGSLSVELKDILLRNFDMMSEAANRGGGLSGVPTGFKELDGLTWGWQKSDLIILAARPAMGKTSLALTLALNAAKTKKTVESGDKAAGDENFKVMLFSLEMSKEQLGQRFLAMESKVGMEEIKKGKLEADEWHELYCALEELSKANIVIEDRAATSVTEMHSICRKLKAEEGLDLVIIDYLQLIEGESRAENRTQVISEISRKLKLMAKDLNCPVIALSQLTREPEKRSDNKPVLSDLRDSGSIEQDADIVIFIYRDDYYDKESERGGEADIIVAKHRNGPTDTVVLTWVERLTKFVDREKVYDAH